MKHHSRRPKEQTNVETIAKNWQTGWGRMLKKSKSKGPKSQIKETESKKHTNTQTNA